MKELRANTEVIVTIGPFVDVGVRDICTTAVDARLGVSGLSIPIAMRHYLQMMGAG